MLISKFFKIEGTLPFVDVDTHCDTKVFVQPFLIEHACQNDPLSERAMFLHRSFGQHIISLVTSGDPSQQEEAKRLLAGLGEMPETRLGYALNSRKGKGVADVYGMEIFDALNSMKPLLAPEVGLDFSEIPCFVSGINADRVSDMTISTISDSLIDYTETMMRQFPELTSNGHRPVECGLKIWDVTKNDWGTRKVTLPVAGDRPLLLIPRSWSHGTLIVSSYRYHHVTVLGWIQGQLTTMGLDGKIDRPSKTGLGKDYPRDPGLDRDVTLEAHEEGVNLIEQFRSFTEDKYQDQQEQDQQEAA